MVAGGGEQICVPQIKFLNFSFFFLITLLVFTLTLKMASFTGIKSFEAFFQSCW